MKANQLHIYKIIKFSLFVLLNLIISTVGYSQTSNWNESLAIKKFTVIIPADIQFNLPTNDQYELGYFIYANSLFSCAGKTAITPGAKFKVNVAFDDQGNVGYKENQQLITLVRNKTTDVVYGIELNYKDAKNKYIHLDSTTAESLKSSTWDFKYSSNNLCSFTTSFNLDYPYGLIPLGLNVSSGIVYNKNSENSYTLFPNKMNAGNYQFSIFFTDISFTSPTYSFNVNNFPNVPLIKSDSICNGETIEIPKEDIVNNLTRTLINTNDSYTINSPGTYYYNLTEKSNLCTTKDTIVIKQKNKCNNSSTVGNKIYINLANNEFVNLNQVDKVEIYDLSLKKIITLQTPTIWKGTDENGTVVPVGIYFMINSNKETTYISIGY